MEKIVDIYKNFQENREHLLEKLYLKEEKLQRKKMNNSLEMVNFNFFSI